MPKRNYRRVVKLLISNGVPKYSNSCPFVLSGNLTVRSSSYRIYIIELIKSIVTTRNHAEYSELFWPVLASDPQMVDDLLLAGCDPQKTVEVNGLRLKPIHLATETHPSILSSLIASRSNPEEKVEKGSDFLTK